MAARTGATTQAVKTRARARKGVAVDAGDGGTGGSGLRLARDVVAQGSAPAVAVTIDAGDGCSGGSGLRLARSLRRLGRGEDEVCEKPNPPSPSFYKPSKAAEWSFSLCSKILPSLPLLKFKY